MHSCFFSTSSSAVAAAIAAFLCASLAAHVRPTAGGSIPGVAERWRESEIERDAPAPVFDESPRRFGLDTAYEGGDFVLGVSAGTGESAGQEDVSSNDGAFDGAIAKTQSQSFRPPRWLLLATQQQWSPVASPSRPSFNNRGFYRASRRSRPDRLKRIVPQKDSKGTLIYL